MRPAKSAQPPSRQGKRQLMVFLQPKLAESVRNRAAYEGKTVQEMLGEAMNAALIACGRKPVFPVGHQRFMVRRMAVAAPRTPEKTSMGRQGRASISGWFDEKCLNLANALACEMGLTLQDLAEKGLALLMATPKVKADKVAAK